MSMYVLFTFSIPQRHLNIPIVFIKEHDYYLKNAYPLETKIAVKKQMIDLKNMVTYIIIEYYESMKKKYFK